jgi:hypothetical protein
VDAGDTVFDGDVENFVDGEVSLDRSELARLTDLVGFISARSVRAESV